MMMCASDRQDLPGPLEPAVPRDTMSEFAGYIVNRLFLIGLRLESARSIIGHGPAGDRIAVATDEADQLIRDIRGTLLDLAEDPQAPLKDRLAQTARELRANALKAAALLQDRADIVGQPSRLDYPAEIKRWQALADTAERMANRWEQPL